MGKKACDCIEITLKSFRGSVRYRLNLLAANGSEDSLGWVLSFSFLFSSFTFFPFLFCAAKIHHKSFTMHQYICECMRYPEKNESNHLEHNTLVMLSCLRFSSILCTIFSCIFVVPTQMFACHIYKYSSNSYAWTVSAMEEETCVSIVWWILLDGYKWKDVWKQTRMDSHSWLWKINPKP